MDPQSGSFTSADTFAGRRERPLTLQRYIYALADPVNRADRTGQFASGSVAEPLVVAAVTVNVYATIMLNLGLLALACSWALCETDERRAKPGYFYRGTQRLAENEAFAAAVHPRHATGHILSDAALAAFFESGHNLAEAYRAGWATHAEWIREFGGNELEYAEAHSLYSAELESDFHRKRTLISVTKFRARAEYFAGRLGRVYQAKIPPQELIPGYVFGTEGEFLLRVGRTGFERAR